MSQQENVSYSEIIMHRNCPQQWMYRYHFGLRPDDQDKPAPERDFGSWWSAVSAADALERGREADSLVARPRTFGPIDGVEFDQSTVTVREVFDAADEWWQHRSPAEVEAWQYRIGSPLVPRLRGAYERWKEEHAEAQKTERPLAVEYGWKRELPQPPDDDGEWERLMSGLTVSLVGYSDEIYEDTRRGLVVLRDGKTTKSLSTGGSALDSLMDSQLSLNAWGAALRLKKDGISFPRAVQHDRLRSVAPTLPKLNKSGTLSKQTTMYDLKTYLDWVAEGQQFEGTARDGSKAGVYESEQAVIDRLSAPAHRAQFHQRETTPLSHAAVRTHLLAAVDTALDIQRTRKRVHARGEASRNLGSACKWCDFASLCRAQMFGGAQGEYRLDEHGLTAKDGAISIEFGVRNG